MDTRPYHHKYLNAPPLTTPEEPSHRENHYFNILYTKINGKTRGRYRTINTSLHHQWPADDVATEQYSCL